MGRSFARSMALRPMLRESTVPALVYEKPRIPKVPVTTPLGVVVGGAGALLFLDGLLSILGSNEQTPLATISRIFRMAVGTGLVVWVAASGRK